ncbi:MAG: nicotinate-nucleotide--dimethylbenzimidazole phosphoribosyltransferase [Selenomonadaceae bacterium]|nr:nicotinate-nucleotide--dimethylbenzimidazole phosphoribosyltransferase [Selenomonadaceae bacterium]
MTFSEQAELYRSVGKSKKCTFIFCSDNGVAKENVSAYPQKTTADMVKNYLVDAGAAANAFAKFAYSELYIVDVGVDADIVHLPGLVDRKISRGTKNIAKENAMTIDNAMKSVRVGKRLAEEAIAAGCNCFLIGEMGIGNTTVAAAMTAAYLDLEPEEVTGRGSNIDDEKFKNKIEIVRKALEVNKPNPDSLLDVLTKVGGYEFGAMAGVIIAAYHHKCVVMLDGFNSAVGALVAEEILPHSVECLIASHVGREVGHKKILEHLGLKPIFNLDLALGEAVGASIAARILDNLVYIFVCGPDADFEGELEEEDTALENFKKQLGLDEIEGLDSIEDIQELFGDEIQIEEIPLDFHVSEHRMESVELPFSTQTLNIPRSYPMAIRIMGDDEDELIAATDRTFNFYLQTMPRLHDRPMNNCRELLDSLTKPKGSLGYLEEIAIQVAGISNEDCPTNKLRHAALAFTNFENCPSIVDPDNYNPKDKEARRDISMDFSATTRTFGMKIFLGIVNPEENLNVAFNFGRNLAEEISFDTPIIALTDLSNLLVDKLADKFADELLTANGDLKYPPEEFLQHVPKDYQCMTSSIIGAIVAAAHNSTLIVVDIGAVDIITRYLEKICPAVRPFILHSAQLIEYKSDNGEPTGFDGEAACMGVEIVEAALTAINEMKTFADTGVAKAMRN